MATSPSNSILQYLRALAATWEGDPRNDTELLECYVTTSDEKAFTVLLRRHGRLVWRVCRDVLKSVPDAEDAFQAVFLLLARTAGKLRGETLAGWLHCVARRTALNLRTTVERRRQIEKQVEELPQLAAWPEAHAVEKYAVLDEELAHLAERLRVPLVLRYLEGKTLAEVARITGCSVTAVTKRLDRGEALLRERLTKRGLEVGMVAALLTDSAAVSTVPAGLIGSTARATVEFQCGTLTNGATEAARTMLRKLTWERVMQKIIWLVLANVGLCGTGLVAWQAYANYSDDTAAVQPVVPAREVTAKSRGEQVDLYGDPLPESALARLGTTRWRHEGHVGSACFMPDGKAVVAVDEEILWMWQFPGGKLLKRITLPEIVRKPNQMTFGLSYVTASADGKLIAVGTLTGETELWDPIANKRVRQMKGSRSERVCALAFLPGGKILACGSINISPRDEYNQSVRLWDVLTGKELLKLESRADYKQGVTRGIAFAPNRRIAAMGASNGVVRLWDLESGKPVRDLKVSGELKATKQVRPSRFPHVQMVFSADGQKLVTGLTENDGWVTIWEVSTGKQLRRLKVAEDKDYCCGFRRIVGLQLSLDGKTLAAGISARTIQLWDAQTGERLRTLTSPSFTMVRPLAFSSDSKTLVAGGVGTHCLQALQMWDVSTGKLLPTPEGQENSVIAVAFSSDGKSLASCGDNTLVQWDISTFKLYRRFEDIYKEVYNDIDILAYSPDNKVLAGAGTAPSKKNPGMRDWSVVWLWDAVTGKRLYQLKCERGALKTRSRCTSLAFSLDGKTLATGWSDSAGQGWNIIELWQVDTGRGWRKLHRLIVGDGDRSDKRRDRDTRISDRGIAVTFSPHGRRLISMCGSETTIWDTVTGKPLRKISRIPSGSRSFDVSSATFSLDGKMLASHDNGGINRRGEEGVGEDKTVRLEEVASGQERLRIPVGSSHVKSLALSPDGRLMASRASDELVVRLWDATTGKQLHQFPASHSWFVDNRNSLAFAPDGKTLAASNPDSTVLIWDVTPWAEKKMSAANVPSAELRACCSALAGSGAAAYEAMWKLVAVSDQAVPLLAELLRPAPSAPNRVRSLLTDLDSNDFQVRKRAQKELEKMGRETEPFLRQALKDNKLSLEARRNIERMLEKFEVNGGVSPWLLPLLRSVEVLERIGTPAARQALEKVAATPPGEEVGEEARAALQRLSRRLP